MHVYLSDPSVLRNLQDFLRRSECIAEQRRSQELEVFLPGASDAEARREVNVFLAMWQARNPGVDVYVTDGAEPSE